MTCLRSNYIPPPPGAPPPRARAFSLVELVVSIGVLVLLLGMASQVMNLTVQATGQAQALVEVNQKLRVLEQTLRKDLLGVDRKHSVMAIVGNPINAYWTKAGAEADDDKNPVNGYPHGVDPVRNDPLVSERLERPRADVLMFFTEREATSNIHPLVRAPLQQIVYGHAVLGEYGFTGCPSGEEYCFTPDALLEKFPLDPLDENTFFSVPAEQWALARRNVLLSPTHPAVPLMDPMPTRQNDPRILRGETDVIENFVYETAVLEPSASAGLPQYLPEIFEPHGSELNVPYARSRIDPTPPPAMAHTINQLFLDNCASFKVEWALDPDSAFVAGGLYGENQIHWIDMGALGDPNANTPGKPLASLERAFDEAQNQFDDNASLANQKRMFQLQNLLTLERGQGENFHYSLRDRFQDPGSVWVNEAWIEHGPNPRANVAVFTAKRKDASGNDIPEDIFPKMLRITVDLYDTNRRLEKPIRHVMILQVGCADEECS